MEYKVAELEGALLDAAVAKAEGLVRIGDDWRTPQKNQFGGALRSTVIEWMPSERWDQGGPIIERERIGISHGTKTTRETGEIPCWFSYYVGGRKGKHDALGPTPLIAAMRAFVSSKFGETVELP